MFFSGNGGSSAPQKENDKHNLTSTTLAGNDKLERCFDAESTVSDPDKGEHVTKLQTGLVELGFVLPQFGVDGIFGKETKAAVKEFQATVGMSIAEQDGVVGRKTIGLLDLSLRNSRVETDPDLAENDFKVEDKGQEKKDTECKGKPVEQACPTPNDSVNKAADDAIIIIDKVINEQLPPDSKTDFPKIFDTIFRFNDPGIRSDKAKEVKDNFLLIRSFISGLKSNPGLVRCGSDCDGGCRSETPAYHSLAASKHIITFCPSFDSHEEKILVLLHESHHASVGGSRDFAYAFTRLFTRLDHTKALKNAASFHVYAGLVDKPGSQQMGPAIKDTNTITDNKQKEQVDASLAFMEQWFTLLPFDISSTIKGAERAREKGKYVDHNPRVFMDLVFSEWFGLTSPPAVPTKTDIIKLKAIEERSKKMEGAFKVPFIIFPTPQNSFWERGPGSGIALNPALLNLDLEHMTTALLQELVHATPDISAGSEPLYVGTINDMRNLRNLDP